MASASRARGGDDAAGLELIEPARASSTTAPPPLREPVRLKPSTSLKGEAADRRDDAEVVDVVVAVERDRAARRDVERAGFDLGGEEDVVGLGDAAGDRGQAHRLDSAPRTGAVDLEAVGLGVGATPPEPRLITVISLSTSLPALVRLMPVSAQTVRPPALMSLPAVWLTPPVADVKETFRAEVMSPSISRSPRVRKLKLWAPTSMTPQFVDLVHLAQDRALRRRHAEPSGGDVASAALDDPAAGDVQRHVLVQGADGAVQGHPVAVGEVYPAGGGVGQISESW